MSRSQFSLFLLAALLAVTVARAQTKPEAGLLPWPQVKQKTEAHWKNTYPTEKILAIEPKGGTEYSSSQRTAQDTTISDWWGTTWITSYKEIHGSFARQVVLVTVERANQSRARFEVAALYKGEGKSWLFDKIAVGPVTELGSPGGPAAPADPQAAEIFKQAWATTRPDFVVVAVSVLAPPKLGQSGERRWLNYRLAIDAAATDKAPASMRGKNYRCTPADYASVLKWDPDKKTWAADDKMIQNINEARDCDPAK